jgi:hypothetical protein
MVHARDLIGVNMPEVIRIAARELRLNGMGIGTELSIFKVYVVGLYLEGKTADPQSAIGSDQAKRIALTLLRDVSRERFVQAVEKGMTLNSGVSMSSLRGRLDTLERALPALQRGNVIDFTYLPGTGTVVRGQGRELTIPGKDFSDALLSVWLGPKAANRSLRYSLLGK